MSFTVRRALLGGVLGLAVVVGTHVAAAGEAEPRREAAIPGCLRRASLSAAEGTRYQRFTVLPRLYDRWQREDCFPRPLDERTLTAVPPASGALIDVNGREAVVVHLDERWLDACASEKPVRVRLDPPSGLEVRRLRDAIRAEPSLRDVDFLEIGLARAYGSNGGVLWALELGTLERSVRLQCYAELDPMVDQAARIFGDDRRAVEGLYDFLNVERGTEKLARGLVPTTTRRPPR